ncbi:MAG TPA: sigma-70 family RNA polymerase sigma factor [Thermomicrobiales bacterium]|nr:sigma-70 family RNA polymerase sigma factor [Thermomicrobiales bacterium]
MAVQGVETTDAMEDDGTPARRRAAATLRTEPLRDPTSLYPNLLRYARRFVSTREEAEDLVQDTYLRLAQVHKPITPAYCYTTLRHIAVDGYRHRRGTRPPLPLDARFPAPRRDLADDAAVRILLDRTLAALAEEPYGAVLVGLALGMTVRELSARDGLPSGTIKSGVHRLRAQLGPLVL